MRICGQMAGKDARTEKPGRQERGSGAGSGRKTHMGRPPRRPKWFDAFLDFIRQGYTVGWAALQSGVAEKTVGDYLYRRADLKAEYTQAVNARKQKMRNAFMRICLEQAAKGSTWHLARAWAFYDIEGWRELCQRLNRADDRRQALDVTDGALTFRDVVAMAADGGFGRCRRADARQTCGEDGGTPDDSSADADDGGLAPGEKRI